MNFRATIACVAALSAAPALAEDVEVLHWWTSGGEAAALNVLKDNLQKEGVGWVDMPVAGGAGTNAMTVLRARVTAGNPPTSVQLLGFDLRDWQNEGVLANLDATAEAEGWDEVIPAALQEFAKHDGHWTAAPVNVHSTNWVWANKAMMDELGVEQPADWDSFIAALDAAKEAGKTPLGFGGQPWQEATVFEAVALATGGADFYRKVFIDLDEDAIRSDTMKQVFDRMETLRGYVDDNFSGRDWNLATAMVINGEAMFQMMGDWAKGEFVRADMTAGEDFACFRFPGTQGVVTFNSDMFAMFAQGDEVSDAQAKLAAAIEDPAFQSAFNVVKGSVPARTDVSDEAFDACGKKGMKDLVEAAESGNLIGSMAHGYAAPAAIKNAFFDVVTAHFSGEYGADEAIDELVTSIETAQ